MKLAALLFVLAPSTAFAQLDASAQLRPITAPVRYAGVYHLGTGSWSQPGTGSLAAASAAGVVYDNTCATGYYFGMHVTEQIVDEGRLPSPTSPVIANAFGLGHDSEVGTQTSYTIDGFQLAYCTLEATPRSYFIAFHQAYNTCTAPPAVSTAAFVLSGLPASATAGPQACWIVDIDLCASSQSFTMAADANGVFNGGPQGNGDTFGWAVQLVSPAPLGGDGLILAGGRIVGGSYQTCSGSDGTVFDSGTASPIYPANSDAISLACGSLPAGAAPEQGSGMGSLDSFYISGVLPTGCYSFGGWPPANHHLQLYSSNVTLPSGSMNAFCDPGVSGVLGCPCSNPPAGSTRGCDNSAATGGASMVAAGTPSLAQDTLVITTANQRPTGLTILLQGSSTIPAGSVFGQGVRCVAGTTKRLYTASASGGGVSLPAPGNPSISARSAALGDPIASGSHRYYMAYYRDPIVLGGCSANATFNATNAGDVTWN